MIIAGFSGIKTTFAKSLAETQWILAVCRSMYSNFDKLLASRAGL